jgi:hypothetical protein
MHKRNITQTLTLAGIAPAGKLSHAYCGPSMAALAAGAVLLTAVTGAWSQEQIASQPPAYSPQ